MTSSVQDNHAKTISQNLLRAELPTSLELGQESLKHLEAQIAGAHTRHCSLLMGSLLILSLACESRNSHTSFVFAVRY